MIIADMNTKTILLGIFAFAVYALALIKLRYAFGL